MLLHKLPNLIKMTSWGKTCNNTFIVILALFFLYVDVLGYKNVNLYKYSIDVTMPESIGTYLDSSHHVEKRYSESEASAQKEHLETNLKTKINLDEYYNEKKLANKNVYYDTGVTHDPSMVNQYWIDMESRDGVVKLHKLSNAHRRANIVELSFDFPFYGYSIRNVTITSGGFISTTDYAHKWLAATQYIAPLMADFDTTLTNDSSIRYVDNGTAFTVQWDRLPLRNVPESLWFSFQAKLHKDGDIVFVYKTVPLNVESISDNDHPVKIGLSDAYIIDQTSFGETKKVIHEYNRLALNKAVIKNSTVVYLTALPTCLNSKNCRACLVKVSNQQCGWCSSIGLCSNGIDRHREEWIRESCDQQQIINSNKC